MIKPGSLVYVRTPESHQTGDCYLYSYTSIACDVRPGEVQVERPLGLISNEKTKLWVPDTLVSAII
jgi:hypothetical protein